MAGPTEGVCLTLVERAVSFSKVAVSFYKPVGSVWGFQSLCILAKIWYCQSSCFHWSGSCEIISHCGFDLHFPDAICMPSFVNCLFRPFCLRSLVGRGEFIPNLRRFFRYSRYKFFIRHIFCQFFPVCGLSTHIFSGVFDEQILKILMRSNLIMFLFYAWQFLTHAFEK